MKLFKSAGAQTRAFGFYCVELSRSYGLCRVSFLSPVQTRSREFYGVIQARLGPKVFNGAPAVRKERRSRPSPSSRRIDRGQAKLDVTDANGTTWRAKFKLSKSRAGSEVHAEIAASRLMWALGYPVEENYYVPEGRIEGVHGLRRDAARVIGPDGSFQMARFESGRRI